MRKVWFIAFILLSTEFSVVFSEHVTTKDPNIGNASLLPGNTIRDSHISFQGFVVKEDPFEGVDGTFINPNESRPHLWKPCLKSLTGTYIGVGSGLRALSNAALGDFEDIVQFDYDLGISAFNRINLELIKRAKTRHEYLSLLYTGAIQEDLIAQKPLDDQSFVAELVKRASQERFNSKYKKLGLNLPEFSAEYSKYIDQRSKEINGFIAVSPSKTMFDILEGKVHLPDRLRGLIHAFEDGEAWQSTILGDDALYQRIRQKVLDGKVTIVTGNLVGSEAMRTLGNALRKNGKRVGALDISNTMQLAANPQTRDGFFRNLNDLPWSEDGRLLFTSEINVPSAKGNLPYGVIGKNELGEIERRYRNFTPKQEGESPLDSLFIKGGGGKDFGNGLFSYPPRLCEPNQDLK